VQFLITLHGKNPDRMAKNYFSRKPLSVLFGEADEVGEHTLKRTLGATHLVLLGIGAIIGAGLFSITGGAAANNAGPAVTISFIIAVFAMRNLHP